MTDPGAAPPAPSARPFEQRFERTSIAVVVVTVCGAVVWPGGGAGVAVAVASGAALAGYGYWGVRRAVDGAILGRKPGPFALVNFFTRNAILALAAYVMLARLRVSPVGLTVGASWPVVAACAAAARYVIPGRHPGNPRQ